MTFTATRTYGSLVGGMSAFPRDTGRWPVAVAPVPVLWPGGPFGGHP